MVLTDQAQLGGSRSDFDALIGRAAERSLDIYLKAARGESAVPDDMEGGLLKIGELAKAAGEPVPTIRFWTSQRLLEVAEVTASGYQLYSPDMVERCALIRKLKDQRLTLAEIKSRIPL